MSKKELPDVMKAIDEYYSWKESAMEIWKLVDPICAALSHVSMKDSYSGRLDIGDKDKRGCEIFVYNNRVYFGELKLNDGIFPVGYKPDISDNGASWLAILLEVILPTILKYKEEIASILNNDIMERQKGASNLEILGKQYNDVLAASLLLKGEDKK